MPVALMRFEFPAGLPCTPDVLGLRSPIALPKVHAEICMPVESKRQVGFEGAFAPPRLRGMKWFTRINDHHSRDDWLGWAPTIKVDRRPMLGVRSSEVLCSASLPLMHQTLVCRTSAFR